jgi:hypothetical protein
MVLRYNRWSCTNRLVKHKPKQKNHALLSLLHTKLHPRSYGPLFMCAQCEKKAKLSFGWRTINPSIMLGIIYFFWCSRIASCGVFASRKIDRTFLKWRRRIRALPTSDVLHFMFLFSFPLSYFFQDSNSSLSHPPLVFDRQHVHSRCLTSTFSLSFSPRSLSILNRQQTHTIPWPSRRNRTQSPLP